MHLGRFNWAVWSLHGYFESLNINSSIAEMTSALSAFASSRNTSHLQQFRDSLSALKSKVPLYAPELDLPSVRALLEDIGAGNSYGRQLMERIDAAIAGSQLAPEELISSLQTLGQEQSALIQRISALAKSLDELGVEYEQVIDDEAEFGISIPQELVGHDLKALMGELTHIDRLFKAFSELAGNGGTSPKVRTLATSWWQIFLDLGAVDLAAWTVALERIVALMKSMYEIRLLKKNLEERSSVISQETLERLEADLQASLKNGLTDIASTLRRDFSRLQNEERCNELEIQIRHELLHLMKRVNGGAQIELRAGRPKKPEAPGDGATEGETSEYQNQLVAWQERRARAIEANKRLVGLSNALHLIEPEPLLIEQSPPPADADDGEGRP